MNKRFLKLGTLLLSAGLTLSATAPAFADTGSRVSSSESTSLTESQQALKTALDKFNTQLQENHYIEWVDEGEQENIRNLQSQGKQFLALGEDAANENQSKITDLTKQISGYIANNLQNMVEQNKQNIQEELTAVLNELQSIEPQNETVTNEIKIVQDQISKIQSNSTDLSASNSVLENANNVYTQNKPQTKPEPPSQPSTEGDDKAPEANKETAISELQKLVDKVEPVVNGNIDNMPTEASLKAIIEDLQTKLNIAKSSIANKNEASVTVQSIETEQNALNTSYSSYINTKTALVSDIEKMLTVAGQIPATNPKYNDIQAFIRENNDCASSISLAHLYNCRVQLSALLDEAKKANSETPSGQGQPGDGTPGGQGQSGSGTPGGQGQSGSGTPGGQGQPGAGTPGGQGQSGSGTPGGQTQPGSGAQGSQSQPGSNSQDGQGQPGSGTQGSQSQPGSNSQDGQGQPGSNSQDGQSQPGSGIQGSQSQPGSSSQGGQSQPGSVTPGIQSQPSGGAQGEVSNKPSNKPEENNSKQEGNVNKPKVEQKKDNNIKNLPPKTEDTSMPIAMASAMVGSMLVAGTIAMRKRR